MWTPRRQEDVQPAPDRACSVAAINPLLSLTTSRLETAMYWQRTSVAFTPAVVTLPRMDSDITRLLAQYAGTEPRRAAGGIYAMAGFAFQARVYVAELTD